jgi:hypothetical protein
VALTPLLQTLRDVLRPGLASAGAIRLGEDDPDSTIPTFQLKTTQPTLVLRFDRVPLAGMSVNDRLFPLLNHQLPGLCVCCDYVLLWQRKSPADAPLCVVLVELKSGHGTGAQKQIENTRLLFDHLLSTLRHHRGVRLPAEQVQYRGVIFTPGARPPGGDPKRVPCPYQRSSAAMPDVPLVRHPPCDGYFLDWFCADLPRAT